MSTPQKIPLPEEIRELFRQAGRRGGKACAERHGRAFYEEIGRAGGSVPKRKTTERVATEAPEQE